MKRIAINKRTLPIMIYTITILSSIYLAVHPETNSLYVKNAKPDEILAYSSSLITTYLGKLNDNAIKLINKSDDKNAIIQVTIPRDPRYKGKDKYTIEAYSYISSPDSMEEQRQDCTLTKFISSSLSYVDGKKDYFKFSNDTGIVEMTCPVTNNATNNDDIKINITIHESVNNEDPFLVRKASFTITYQEYLEFIGLAETNLILSNSTSIYADFMKILETYWKTINLTPTNEFTYDIFENYINICYGITNDETAKDKLISVSDEDFSILGVTRAPYYDEETSDLIGYIFNFDPDFIGYVKTNNFYDINKETKREAVYFSSDVKIKEVLTNSLNKWSFKGKEFTINGNKYSGAKLVLDYIDAKLNSNYTLDNLKSISGIIYRSTPSPYYEFDETILDRAINYANKNNLKNKNAGLIKISYYSNQYYLDYMYDVTIKAISDIFGDYNTDLGNVLILDLYYKRDLYKAITCTTTEECQNYLGYSEIYYSNGKYYQIKVVHHTSDSEKYNEIIITEGDTFDSTVNVLDSSITSGIAAALNPDLNNELYKAVTCEENCTEYSEIHYNKSDTEYNGYLLIDVKPNDTYNANKIAITKGSFEELVNNMNNLSSANKKSLLASYNNTTGGLLNIYLTTSSYDDKYNEIHYDGSTDILIEVANVKENYNSLNIANLNSNEAKTNLNNISELRIYILENSGIVTDDNEENITTPTELIDLETTYGFKPISYGETPDLEYYILYMRKN